MPEIDSSGPNSPPRVAVIIRSYNRLPALCELVERLRAQDHDSFEIVIVDQSTTRDPDADARLHAIAQEDPRVRLLRYPPLGGPRARNEGVRAARGELLLFIDDDDLPASADWIRLHEQNFADPKCLAATGRFLLEGGKEPPYANMDKARARVLTFNVLRWQRVYARVDRRARCDSAMGGNAAWRRAALERFGLWDECTPIEDEPSLCYRLARTKAPDEYLVFDPAPQMIRRRDIPGGMDKRQLTAAGYGARLFEFFHNIVAHYFPVRFALLYPAYVAFLAYQVYDWIFDDSKHRRGVAASVAVAIGFSLALPLLWTWWLARWWVRRVRGGPLVHAPTLAPTDDTRRALAGP
jgi:glycosyltransferase involved in cell wall biosynthesis